MSCLAVAPPPALCHSPSIRHPDDSGLLCDIRSSLPSNGLDISPTSPLICVTPKLSPLLCPLPMPPPRVPCSPKTPPSSWGSPLGTPTSRALCFCGPFSMCSSCSCTLASGAPSETRWRPPLDRCSSNDPHFESKRCSGTTLGLESPSPRRCNSNSNASISSHSPLFSCPSSSPRLSPSICGQSVRYSKTVTNRPYTSAETPSSGFPKLSLFTPGRPLLRRSFVSAKVHPVIDIEPVGGQEHCNLGSTDANFGGVGTCIHGFKETFSKAIPQDENCPPGLRLLIGDDMVREPAGQGGRPTTPPLKRKRPPKLEIPHGVGCVIPNNPLHVVNLGEECLNEMSVEGPFYGISCKRGRRDVLEDTHRAYPDLNGDPGQAFFGVFDGHGGRKAADFAAQNLVHNIVTAMKASDEEGFYMETAVRAGYLATDADFLRKCTTSGTSCVTALMKDGYMVVANAGDCRAVMSRAGSAEALTSDHRAGREDERLRIEALGGFVDNFTGIWRVQGTLAVSRGIGDAHLKEWISAEPEITKLRITPECEFLILASDGLWDLVSNQEAVDVARPLLQLECRESVELSPSRFCSPTSGFPVIKEFGNKRADSASKNLEDHAFLNLEEQACLQSLEELCGKESGSEPQDAEVDIIDICHGKLDADVPSIGFSELSLPLTGPLAACRKLLEISLQRGGHDDITVMIVKLQNFGRIDGTPSSIAHIASRF